MRRVHFISANSVMNDYEHVFAPSLTSSFARKVLDSTDLSFIKTLDKRFLFYQLNQPDNYQQAFPLAYDFICYQLSIAKKSYSSRVIHPYEKRLAHLISPDIPPIPQQFISKENQLECLKQTVAIQLTQPCWLQNISQTSCSQNKSAIQIMSIYLYLKKKGGNQATIDELFKSLLLFSGINLPPLYSQTFCEQNDILSEVFNFASVQLALSRFPRLFFPEIIGFTLACCQMPTLLEICFPDHPLPLYFFQLRQQKVSNMISAVQQCITDHLDLFPQQKETLWLRVQNGFFLYQQEMQCCRDGLDELMRSRTTPQQQIVQLFQQKAVAAMGHHQKVMIDGVALEQWFAQMPENSQAFLNALKKSDYVDKNKPENSRLLKLFDFRGPMSGVMSQTERELLLTWLKDDENEVLITHSVESSVDNCADKVPVSSAVKFEKLNTRALYYYLVNADLFPDVLSTAKNKIKKLFNCCDFFCRLPFKKYNHKQFDSFIADIYHREIAAYRPLLGQPKISKSAYIWGLEQIAPMILIDGCWLQNSLHIENTNPKIAEILFHIYCDEVGNGVLEQNHAYIFLQLLESLSISVPAVHSRQFADHPGFINSAFDLPVFMLVLSHFSIQFLPELLGLNMAIELSGLGKSYMQLVDDWNYWGIDPHIAQIHISIDNYATGHTFLAKQAIKLHLDQILQNTGDQLIVNKHWRRIYCGYSSLRFVGSRFRYLLPASYLWAKGAGKK